MPGTELLLDIWTEKDIEFILDNPKLSRNGVNNEVIEGLSESGTVKTVKQTKRRIKFLKQSYRKMQIL